jgi:hypothetical protein
MPEIVQPIVSALPLSVVVTGLRDIANDGVSLFSLNGTALGIFIWMILSFILATRFFVWKEVAK